MVLCRKNRPCGLKFGLSSSGGGGGTAGGGQATAPPVTHQLMSAGCGLQAHMAAVANANNNNKNGFSGDCDVGFAAAGAGSPMDTAQLSNVGPTRVLSHLYIGSQADAMDAEVMQRCGITHVINVSIAGSQSQHVADANFMRIPVNDGYTDKLLPHFQRAFNFLERVRENSGRCLVHCLAGISRSPTLSIAYIMMHCRMTQDEAYRFVKQRRRHISPNFNFLGQLLEFERQLRQASTAQADASAVAAAVAAPDDQRPDAKRQRKLDLSAACSPTGAALAAMTSAAADSTSIVAFRRPRSVLLAGGTAAFQPNPVRRSRSSDAFLETSDELEDGVVNTGVETVGAEGGDQLASEEPSSMSPVACLS